MRLHLIAGFSDGVLSMATVEGLEFPEKLWVVYAGNGKFAIRLQSDNASPSKKEELFDSPEQALEAIEEANSDPKL